MAFKRKRSIDDSPQSISSFAPSTPDAQSPTPRPLAFDGSMDIDMDVTPRADFNAALNRMYDERRAHRDDGVSRTRKRFRDGRPDERLIHESTINKLFAAQRAHPHASPILSPSEPALNTIPRQAVQKSTLHSFWNNLPAPPVQPLTFATQQPHHQASQSWDAMRCEDCDSTLQQEGEAMALDGPLQDDGYMNGGFGCSDCGKNVCGTCAVVGQRRTCLACATSGRRREGRWW